MDIKAAEGAVVTKPKNCYTCYACSYSYMEPDSPLICGHPDAGSFGLHIYTEPLAHCPDFVKYKQHPMRRPDGSLKK